jgi:flavin-dependent dehydrogenase
VRDRGAIIDIAIIGGGIAGAAAAVLLARQGYRVCLFDDGSALEPEVGESLLPTAVPIIRELLGESDIKAVARLKPGLTFDLPTGRKLSFHLRDLEAISAGYAYNVARPQFDALLRHRALAEGARLVSHRVGVRSEEDQIFLNDDALGAGGLHGQPDLVLDASGRRQLVTTAMRGYIHRGERSGIAVYAHFRGVELGAPAGHAVLSPMERGWAWRIPLPDRTSVGIVLRAEQWPQLGSTVAERFEAAVRRDPLLRPALAAAEQLSPVRARKYRQYRADRLYGKNWVLLGDAAGFVDPTLSPGVSVALQSTSEFVACLRRNPRSLQPALARWQGRCSLRLQAWNEVAAYFYDGRLFALIQQGEDNVARSPQLRPVGDYLKRAIGATMVGVRTESRLNRLLMRFLAARGLRDYRAEDWAID